MSTANIAYVQRQVTAIEKRVALHDRAVPKLVRQMEDALARIAKLELTVEALVRLQTRGGVSREEIQQLMQRIDLADGFEDGLIGPDESEYAHSCDRCGLPVNPKRVSCLYCEAPVDPDIEKRKLPERPVPCAKCREPLVKENAYFSVDGAICAKCHYA